MEGQAAASGGPTQADIEEIAAHLETIFAEGSATEKFNECIAAFAQCICANNHIKLPSDEAKAVVTKIATFASSIFPPTENDDPTRNPLVPLLQNTNISKTVDAHPKASKPKKESLYSSPKVAGNKPPLPDYWHTRGYAPRPLLDKNDPRVVAVHKKMNQD